MAICNDSPLELPPSRTSRSMLLRGRSSSSVKSNTSVPALGSWLQGSLTGLETDLDLLWTASSSDGSSSQDLSLEGVLEGDFLDSLTFLKDFVRSELLLVVGGVAGLGSTGKGTSASRTGGLESS